MSTQASSNGDRLRSIVTRIHAVVLLVVCVTAAVAATVGWRGSGPYDVLADQPWGFIGLFQAYLLMAIIATVAWTGSFRRPGRTWNWLLLIAHVPPMLMIIFAYGVFAETGQEDKANLGLAIHVPLMMLETFALLWKASLHRAPARVAPRRLSGQI
jgi:hypothetical protein